MEFSAPFLATYWPYIASILVGVILSHFVKRSFQPQSPGYTVDVDPSEDNEHAAIPPADPLTYRPIGEGNAPNIASLVRRSLGGGSNEKNIGGVLREDEPSTIGPKN